MPKLTTLTLAAGLLAVAPAARGAVVISEYAYSANDGEFVEFTNTGPAAVDFTGYSFDDNNRRAGTSAPFDLSAVGTLAPGAAAVLTESNADAFRAAWSIPAGVAVVGDLGANQIGNNLGRSDEINLYDASAMLVDRLTYNDQGGLGPRTQNASGNVTSLGANNAASVVLSTVGDAFGSYASTGGDVGNPGVAQPVPEPATLGLAVLAGTGLLARRRR